MDAELEQALAQQRRYYDARASEYEDWWYRRGRYDHGVEAKARWFADIEQVRAALDRFAPSGRVLELACGTGIWTQRLAASASALTALDASPEALSLARAKVGAERVRWVLADVFAWEPPEAAFDVCFFGFWLSHVPGELMGAFWEKVGRALAPEGRVFIVDSALSERATARDHATPRGGERIERRRLADGREFEIVKHWFEAPALRALIEQAGWDARIEQSEEFFVYGEASPRRSPRGRDGV